jgi:very-short-patch-repair endonuclease
MTKSDPANSDFMKSTADPTPTLPLAGEGDLAPLPYEGGGREGVFNHISRKSFRRELRRNSTAPEQKLWAKIRGKQLGVKFRRQHGIGRYIADFYCPEYALVIELDGDSHYREGAKEYDHIRDNFMRSLGLHVLRFSNHDVMRNIEGVVATINLAITPALVFK